MKGVVKPFKVPSHFSAVYGQGKDAPAVYNPCKNPNKIFTTTDGVVAFG